MASYVIGDVQGCYTQLMKLLEKIKFNENFDKLIFAGDLVNRGKQSLDVLRLIKLLGKSAKIVLGNHDLYLLAIAHGYYPLSRKDNLDPVLKASDKEELIQWLRQQHFLYIHKKHIIIHAGIPPIWSLKKAKRLALELEFVMQTDICFQLFIGNLFDNKVRLWNDNLKAIDRWCCIANYFTQLRLCDHNGNVNFSFKGELKNKPKNFDAWFNFTNSISKKYTVIFGHWAALNGKTNNSQYIAIDTGCVWGKKLSAYCIESKTIHQVNATN